MAIGQNESGKYTTNYITIVSKISLTTVLWSYQLTVTINYNHKLFNDSLNCDNFVIVSFKQN